VDAIKPALPRFFDSAARVSKSAGGAGVRYRVADFKPAGGWRVMGIFDMLNGYEHREKIYRGLRA
jgi:hypothetical protein